MPMDEEDATKIAKGEVEASLYEVEQDNIHIKGEDDGESHCDKTHVDDDYKVRYELMNLATTNELGEVEIVSEQMHA